jgi:hypothetical protein
MTEPVFHFSSTESVGYYFEAVLVKDDVNIKLIHKQKPTDIDINPLGKILKQRKKIFQGLIHSLF